MKALLRLAVISSVGFFILSVDAYGYIDPGTGSYIIQLLIAAFVGISLSVRIFWKRIVRLFRGKKPPQKEPVDGQ